MNKHNRIGGRIGWHVLPCLLVLSACSKGGLSLPHSTMTEDQAASARAACTFTAGSTPGSALAADALLGDQIPIDHVVLLMMENRSFDHMLSDLRTSQTDADVMPLTASNPDTNGDPVLVHHLTEYCFDDPDHSWDGARAEYDNGLNDGFVKDNAGAPNDPTGARVVGYYTTSDIPFLYWAANEFAIGDRYFSALLGPTFPNRLFFYAGTSFGNIDNTVIGQQTNNIMENMQTAKLDWRVYSETIPGMGVLIVSTSKYLNTHFFEMSQFYTDAAAGKLGQVTFLDPDLSETKGAEGDDEHPPGNVQVGDLLISKLVGALMQSPDWPRTAMFITYDENGGLYDHVAPPAACTPDNDAPMLSGEPTPAPPGFDRLGFRVPFIVISPYAKRHYVSHEVYDHTSLLKFLEARFGLPAMTARDANAQAPYDLFDFGSKPVTTTSTPAPTPVPDATERARCAAAYPPMPSD